jgi:hypothetical protein
VLVYNGGANALVVYPPIGGLVNALSANGGVSLSPGTEGRFVKHIGTTAWSFSSGTNDSAVSVKDFGAVGNGVADDSAAFAAAIVFASSGSTGGVIRIPKGNYLIGATSLVLQKHITLRGEGKYSTFLTWTGTGDGIQSTWPINSSTAVNISIEDLTLTNSNGSNIGGGFVDVGGTFIELRRVRISGFAYNVILDQSELADLIVCDFESPLIGCVWLVNGNDHTIGASAEFTNRISIQRSQFNGGATITGIIDDGGYVHSYRDNNYNGCLNHIRLAGVFGGYISGGEFEAAAGSCIKIAATSFNGGDAVGSCTVIQIDGGAMLVPLTNQSCIEAPVSGASMLVLQGITMYANTVPQIVYGANFNTVIADGVFIGGTGPMFASYPTRYDIRANNASNVPTVISNLKAVTVAKRTALTYGTTIATDAALGNEFDITVTDGVAFAISAPTNPTDGQRITYTLRNTSGGAMGVVTWNAVFKMAALTNPATGFSRSIDFRYDGSNWVQISQTGVDVPN